MKIFYENLELYSMYWILEKQPELLTNYYTRPVANILLLQLIMCSCTQELLTHTQCHYQA